MSKVYKFPIRDKSTRWIPQAIFLTVGTILLIIGVFEEGALYFGVPIFILGVLIMGVKRDITIDTATGAITSVRGFFFMTNTEMFIKRDFSEVYIRRRIDNSTGKLRDRITMYDIILNGRCLLIVDSFGYREGAEHWQKELAQALQLALGQERGEDGTILKMDS